MRKFLVKHFVLDYYFKLFGVLRNAPRASRIIFPLFVLTGWVHATNPSIVSWCLIGLAIASLYLGFLHFRLFPVKWEELDEDQKFQYGYAKKLTNDQYKEWLVIVKKVFNKR
jgi:hypothetical protein